MATKRGQRAEGIGQKSESSPLSPNPYQLLVIIGETASGKSDLALKLAKKLNGEIISADSWQVYRGFDIGTAKPSKDEQQAVPHHLIDVVDAMEGFSAPLFKWAAEVAIKNIRNRGKLPILVGGTGLYIDSLIFNYGFLPGAGEAERARLSEMTIPDLLKAAKKHRINLENIDLRNKRRIIRAIEAKGQRPTKRALRPDVLVVGIQSPREELRSRVEKRVEQMFQQGLEQEVKQLSERYGWETEPMKGIGYREFQDYFGGQQTVEQTKQRVISSTMNLAKRQRTWFKRHKFIRWFDSPEVAYQGVIWLLNN